MTTQNILDAMGGGNKLQAMAGASAFLAVENGVQFRIGKGAKARINAVRVQLCQDDTYSLELFRIRGTECETVNLICGIYSENLKGAFEAETGFLLTLPA